MSWVWCGLLLLIGASSVRVSWSVPPSVHPVAACWSIRRVCTRPWPSVRPVLRPRALTVNKSWVFDTFAACVGACQVGGVNGLNVPCSPSRSFLPLGLLPEHGSSTSTATVFRRSQRRPGKWNPSVESSLAPDTPFSFFLCHST